MSAGELSAIAEVFAAVGLWSTALAALFGWLHRRRTRAINDVRAELAAVREQATVEHKLLAAQIQRVLLDIADNFARRSDLRDVVNDIRAELTEARKEIGAVHNRVDQIYHGRGD